MIAPLQAALDAGIKIITVDTFLGNGDYVNGPVTFPLSYIGSDNVEGGRIAGNALADALGGKGNVYIQNTVVGTSTTEQGSEGFKEAIKAHPGRQLVGEDYNNDDASLSTQQTAAVLQREPDLAGIFGVNVFSAQGAGQAVLNAGLGGEVRVIAFDATQSAIEQLRAGTVSLVIAQKPYDMGYLAMEFALADARGVTSLPKRVATGYAVITRDNVDNPTSPASSTRRATSRPGSEGLRALRAAPSQEPRWTAPPAWRPPPAWARPDCRAAGACSSP